MNFMQPPWGLHRITGRLCGILLICACLLGGCAPARSPAAPDVRELTAHLDAIVPGGLAASRAPGVAVALVHNGEVVWAKGFGVADKASRRPVTEQSLFGVASISKSITAWGVMKLVERGQLDLDAPVERYLTRWRLPPSAFDSQEVTIRRLLSHSAGLNTPEYFGYSPGSPMPTVEQVLQDGSGKAEGVRIVNKPGSKFAYSDGGYLILQVVLEEVTGEDFASFMQREVIDPLGMKDSTFARSPEQMARTVISYSDKGEAFPDNTFVELAPAALYTTAPDLARFVAAGMTGPNGEPPGRGVLQPETLALMMTQHIDIRGFDRFIDGQGYGLGYFVETVRDKRTASRGAGRAMVTHMGGNLGGVSEYAALPAEGEGIVILTASICGHEVFADILSAWTDWLGAGQVTLARAIRTSRLVLVIFTAFLGVLAIILGERLVSRLRSGRWRFGLRGRPAWKVALALALPLLFLAFFWRYLFPFFRISMPSVIYWMALAWTSLGVVWLIRGLVCTLDQESLRR